MVVRVVLSHVMQPVRHPAQTADDIAWIAAADRCAVSAARPEPEA